MDSKLKSCWKQHPVECNFWFDQKEKSKIALSDSFARYHHCSISNINRNFCQNFLPSYFFETRLISDHFSIKSIIQCFYWFVSLNTIKEFHSLTTQHLQKIILIFPLFLINQNQNAFDVINKIETCCLMKQKCFININNDTHFLFVQI